MSVRAPVVAGTFYPGTGNEINKLIDRILDQERDRIDTSYAKKDIIGCVVPHAGYVFSAWEAVHFFGILRESPVRYDTFIILNPNHTGYGEAVEADSHESWNTPLGNVPLDRELILKLGLPVANRGQLREHSAEVMLPMLQKMIPYSFHIVPICMLRQNPENAREVAGKIHAAGKQLNRKIMIIASSDFSHFVHPEEGAAKDDLVLDQIRAQDTDKLYETVVKNRITVCGYGPIMTLMEYAKLVAGEFESTVLARGHSGKAGPSDSVVDYITILFYR